MRKRWLTVFCGLCMAVCLTACGDTEDDIQIVEQEELPGQSLTEETEAEETEAEAPEGTEQPEAAGEKVPSEGASEEAVENRPAVVNIETQEQEYKEGDRVVLNVAYDNITVTVEENEAATQAVTAEFEKKRTMWDESVEEILAYAKEDEYIAEAGVSYSSEQGYSVERNDGRILAFVEHTGGYEGGAHGYYGYYGINFDAQTGQLLSIADIAEDEGAFQEICVQEMLRQYEDLKAQQVVFDEEMLPPDYLQEVLEGKMQGDEWYFAEDGICFISNIYEIAPYAAGEITFDIPYDMVNGVLKEAYRE